MRARTDVRPLGTEAVECAARALKSVDDVEGGNGLALEEMSDRLSKKTTETYLGVLSVGDGVANNLRSLSVKALWKTRAPRTFSRKILRTPRVSS